MNLSDSQIRRNKILQSIIETHIQTALPVGSLTVSHKFRGSLSPATIRNVMAELEELGYICHPHTSAGRIPTDKGYRYYVDSLMEDQYLTQEEAEEIEKQYEAKKDAFESIIEETSRILSNITHYAGVVLFFGIRRSSFRKLELILVDPKRILVVLISDSAMVRNSIIVLNEEITQNELQRISKFLNDELEGKAIDEIEDYLQSRLLMEQHSFFHILKRAIEIVRLSSIVQKEEKIYLEGAFYILEQPEFKNSEKLKTILKVLEDKYELLEILSRNVAKRREGVNVCIGSESGCEDIQDCSLVTSSYKIGNRSIGTLGVIGPRRMIYARVISVVNFVSQTASHLLENFAEE